MIVKLRDIIQSKQSFDILVNKKGIPLKHAYSLAKVHRKVQSEFETFSKCRDDKIREVGTLTKNGGYHIKDEDRPKYEQDIADMADVEIEISAEVMSMGIFENCDIEPIVFSDLHWLIKD